MRWLGEIRSLIGSLDCVRSGDNFENGVFWELYKDLENQFLHFLEYVPYLDTNTEVVSFKLLNLVLSIGGHIDSAFKEMARYPEFRENESCKEILEKIRISEERIERGERPSFPGVKLCLEAFEREYRLKERKVTFKRLQTRDTIIPFAPHNEHTRAPVWWDIYNGLKHDVGLNLENANLKHTLRALAGAFLLNVIHIPGTLRLLRCGVLKTGSPDVPPDWMLEDRIRQKEKFPGHVETPIFMYDYYQ